MSASASRLTTGLIDYLGPHCRRSFTTARPAIARSAQRTQGSDKPHNPFGARLAALRDELKKAGKKHDIVSRLETMAAEDSDGDGVRISLSWSAANGRAIRMISQRPAN